MANVESKSIGEAMGNADRRVNINVNDISMEQRFKINALEQSTKDAMRSPNWKDIREKYIKDRSSNDPNKRQSPEDILATAKILFDKVQATESFTAGEQLNELTNQVLLQLNVLKEDLGYSVTQVAVDTRGYSETMSQSSGADKTITESKNLPENMSSVEQLLGIEPSKKLESRTNEVSSLMEDLKRPENATAFISAKTDYASLTDGLYLEDAIPTLDKAFKDSLTALQKKGLDPFKLRGEVMALVEKQLKGLKGLWTVITMHIRESVPPKAHAETTTQHEGKETSPGSLSEEEMAEILQFFCEDFRGKPEGGSVKMPTTISEGLESYYQVVPAYQFYYKKFTGHDADMNAMPIKGAAILGTAQGALNVLVGVDELGLHALNYVGEKTGVAEAHHEAGESGSWAIKFASLAEKVLSRNTIDMLVYGWQNSSAQEKVFLLNKIVTEWYGAGKVYGELLSKFKTKNLGSLGEKFMKTASLPGVKQMMAMAEVVSINCPRLAKYGMTVEEIATGLETSSTRAIKVWDHYILHGAHMADTTHQAEKVLYEPTVGKYTEKVAELEEAKHSFATEELRELQIDLNTALGNTAKLQLSSEHIAELQKEKTEIDHRLQSTEA
jgi:hypothetical protein